MLAPASLPHFPALFSATAALALLTPLSQAADEVPVNARQAIQSSLPRYNPAAHEKAEAERAARAAPKNAPAPLPEPTAASTGTIAAPAERAMELPKMTVRAKTDPPKRLPRIDTPKPVEVEKVDPMESPSGRDARLVQKHLSKFEQRLIKFLGGSTVGKAREAESLEQNAAKMNELAAGIEIQEAIGRDPEEIKKLRAEYTKLYYSGPKW